MTRFRLWRLQRAYARIIRLEQQGVGVEGLALRGEFAVRTFRMMDEEQKQLGWSRQQQRQWKRKLLSA